MFCKRYDRPRGGGSEVLLVLDEEKKFAAVFWVHDCDPEPGKSVRVGKWTYQIACTGCCVSDEVMEDIVQEVQRRDALLWGNGYEKRLKKKGLEVPPCVTNNYKPDDPEGGRNALWSCVDEEKERLFRSRALEMVKRAMEAPLMYK